MLDKITSLLSRVLAPLPAKQNGDFITKLLFFIFVFSFSYFCWLFVSFDASLALYDEYIEKKEISYGFFDYFYDQLNLLYAALFLLLCFFLAWVLKIKSLAMRSIIGYILFFGGVINSLEFPLLISAIWFPYSIFLQILLASFVVTGLKLVFPHYIRYLTKQTKRENRDDRFDRILRTFVYIVIVALFVYIVYILNDYLLIE